MHFIISQKWAGNTLVGLVYIFLKNSNNETKQAAPSSSVWGKKTAKDQVGSFSYLNQQNLGWVNEAAISSTDPPSHFYLIVSALKGTFSINSFERFLALNWSE